MSALSHLSAAFAFAQRRQVANVTRWITVSSIGGSLPQSLLGPAIQQMGRLDVLIRSIEDELFTTISSGRDLDFGFDHSFHLATLWIGSAYEFVRVVNERQLIKTSDAFEGIKRDLSLLRVPLEKHEIEGRKKTGVLQLAAEGEGDPLISTYDPSDPMRAYIMSSGLSRRGSMMWRAYDFRVSADRWIDRRDISDRMLDLWAPA